MRLGKGNNGLQQGLTTCRAAWMYCKKQRLRHRRRRRGFRWMWCGSWRKTQGCDRNVTMQRRCASGLRQTRPGCGSWLTVLVGQYHEGQPRQSSHGQPTRDAERDPLTNLHGSAKELAV